MRAILIPIFAIATLALGTGACGHEKLRPEVQALAEGALSIRADFVKDKGDKFDIGLILRNESLDKPAIIFLGDMECRRGAVAGTLKHTLFNSGEKTIDLRPSQIKSMNLVCELGTQADGEFTIIVHKVFANPNSDGHTPGDVMATDVTWKFSGE